MKSKFVVYLSVLLLTFFASAGVLYAHGSGGSGGDDRVRVEVRTGEDEPEENRVRVEIRGEGATAENALNLVEGLPLPDEIGRVRIEERDDRVRIEIRGPEAEDFEEVEGLEIEGNTFEITGEVTAFTGTAVIIAGHTITIDPGAVANFEQEGTIEVGEVIKVEGFVEDDGTLLAREIEANGVEVEFEDEDEVDVEANLGSNISALISQIIAFFRSMA